MPNSTRTELIRFHDQADNDLDRFLQNCQSMAEIYDKANEQYGDRYQTYYAAVVNHAKLVVEIQRAWKKLRKRL